MYHQSSQHFDLDQQDNAALGFGGSEPTSWLSGEDLRPSSPSHRRNLSALSSSTVNAAGGNVDRVLYNDLVEIVPLIQSLIDQKATSSYTRRGSMIYTKTPSVSNKMTEAKNRNAQSIPGKKRRENGGNEQDADGISMFSSNAMLSKEREELAELREKVEDLKRQLLEKDEILKSAETSKNEINSVHSVLDQVKKQVSEKDVLLRSTQAQLADVKIKLADKQAAVERLQWEAMTSNKKVEKLQEDLNAMQGEMSSYTLLFESLSNDNFTLSDKEYEVVPHSGYLPEIDDMNEMEMSKMEEAQEAYMAAIAAAKEKQDEESIAIAANARLHLQSFVLS